MDSPPCLWWLLVFPATFLLLLVQNHQVAANSLHHSHHHGTSAYVTKNLFFPSFNLNLNPYSSQDIKLMGNAKLSEDVIQIPDVSPTIDVRSQAGRALYASPIRLFDPVTKTPASFQTTFSFKFTATHSDGSVSDEGRGGDGLAFVIVPDELTVGRSGPWLGILDDACNHYKVFAVEFDTSHDSEFGDPDDDHVGVNLGTVVSFKTASLSKANVSLHDNVVHRAWITYDSQEERIEVYLGSDGDPKPSKPILSSPLNLSPFLNEYMFVGFSASTGNLTQIHSVLSWKFSSTSPAVIPKPPAKICHRNGARQVYKYTRTDYTAPPSSFMIFVAITGLCSVALICFYWNSFRRESSVSSPLLVDKKRKPTPPGKPRRYTIVEVLKATRRFDKSEILGSDLGGVLYRGTLPNGCHVAFKRFSNRFLTSSRWESSRIQKRISELSQISHRSLASIRGWCCDNHETIIVYDYFGNGSLAQWLYGVGVLPWSRRFKLIKEIAEALCFLHSKGLAHGNLKTSSVFLDTDYRAVLCDYGFHFFLGKSSQVESVTGMRGDVLGFGMLLLESIAGKKSSKGGEGEMGVLGFAWSTHESGDKAKLVEEIVEPGANWEQVVRLFEVALSCTLSENDGRPSMEEVVEYLNTQKPIPKLPQRRPVELFTKLRAQAN